MIHLNQLEGGFLQALIFDPSSNVWNELLAFDLESLVLQANTIYNINLLEILN